MSDTPNIMPVVDQKVNEFPTLVQGVTGYDAVGYEVYDRETKTSTFHEIDPELDVYDEDNEATWDFYPNNLTTKFIPVDTPPIEVSPTIDHWHNLKGETFATGETVWVQNSVFDDEEDEWASTVVSTYEGVILDFQLDTDALLVDVIDYQAIVRLANGDSVVKFLSCLSKPTVTEHPAKRFLEALGKNEVFVRAWVGKGFSKPEKLKSKAFNVKSAPFGWEIDDLAWEHTQWDRLLLELERNNANIVKPSKVFPYQQGGFCPYAVINDGGHRAVDITQARALFVEFDAPVTKAQALLKLAAFELPPSALIESRNGYHAYWILNEVCTDLKQWQALQKRMIEHFQSDPAICDFSRCMRLPGFYHLQSGEEPFMVVLKECHADRRYTLEQFDVLLPTVNDDAFLEKKARRSLASIKHWCTDQTWDISNFTQYLDHYEPQGRAKCATAQCPNHGGDGHSTDSLHIFHDGAFVCQAGCSSEDIFETINWRSWHKERDEAAPLPTAVDPEEWDRDLEALQQERDVHQERIDQRISDENYFEEAFYLTGIWKRLYGGKLWGTMINRHPALALSIATILMGTVPVNLKLAIPGSRATLESPTLFTLLHGASGKGKSVIQSLLKPTLFKAIDEINSARLRDQIRLSRKISKLVEGDKGKGKRNGETEPDDVMTGIDIEKAKVFNPSLLRTPPLVKMGDTTPEALLRNAAAHQAYQEVSEGHLTATSTLLTVAEGFGFITRWKLDDTRYTQAPTLNGLWNNEVPDINRATDSQYYRITEALVSLYLPMTSDQLLDVLDAEKPQNGKRGKINGFSARCQTLEILKDSSKPEPQASVDHEEVIHELDQSAKYASDIQDAIQDVQLRLQKQGVVSWAMDFTGGERDYVSNAAFWQRVKADLEGCREYCSTPTWTAYVEKLPATLIRLAFGVRLMRLVSDLAEAECALNERVFVEIEDVNVAYWLLNLCIHDRYKYEVEHQQKERSHELSQAESRSVKQNAETVLQRFSDPAALLAWVNAQKEKGRTTVKLIVEGALNGRERKALKEAGIDYRAQIKSVI